MLSFSEANYWDLNVPFTNIRHFPLIITKPHNLSGPFKMHTKMPVILQPCWRSRCKCRVCNALCSHEGQRCRLLIWRGKAKIESVLNVGILESSPVPRMFFLFSLSWPFLPWPPSWSLRTTLDTRLLHYSGRSGKEPSVGQSPSKTGSHQNLPGHPLGEAQIQSRLIS